VLTDVDPDARFLLANERTLLAWLRTSVTVQAGGVGVLHFAPAMDLNGTIGVALILVGALGGVTGYRRYSAADRAIRHGELPPRGNGPAVIAAGIVVLAVVLLGTELIRFLG